MSAFGLRGWSRRLGGLIAARAHPAQVVVGGFALAILTGTVLLSLPVASASGDPTGLVPALFTATSAVCVTGLVVVDTPDHWSHFGQLVILALIQIGGFGIMTLASLLGLLVARRLGLRLQRTAQTETKTLGLGEVRRVVISVITLSVVVEAFITLALALRFTLAYGRTWESAGYLGLFHAVSAFNNAGFALYDDSLVRFATDPWITGPVLVAVVLGGLGFPVLMEVGRRLSGTRRRWSLHARITLITYGVLVGVGIVGFAGIEWNNPVTLGPHSPPGKLLISLFQGITPRTAGFNVVEVGSLRPGTLLINDVLMFIGGGSGGTAGGIKVTTFALLAFVIVTEIRGDPSVHVRGRKIPSEVQRQALTIALLGVALVMAGTMSLLALTGFPLDSVLFESASAFGTVGLSTGITDQLPATGQLVLVLLMFTGRLGPITLASALALRERGRRYDYPEERPIVG